MKHRIVHTLQKFLLNPPIKLALAMGLPLPGYALLETTGRKSGKSRRTPVGDGRIGKQFWLVAEHGMKAGYVRNIQRDPRVRLKLRDGLRTRWHTGTAHLLPDDDPRERQRWLASHLPSSAGNARAVRLFGTQLLTIRIDLVSFLSQQEKSMNSNIEQNKATASAFYDTAFNQKRPEEAVSRYVGNTYIQHNPNFADGPQAFIDAVKVWVGACPSLRTDIKRIIAEGDLVVTHVYIKQHEKDLGTAAIDIFRLEDGKIVEHWDVTTAIPEKSSNNNTMF